MSIWRTKWLWAALALLVVVILLTALVGVDNYGAKRWLRLGPVTIQVSEFAKIVFVLVSARIYTDFVSGEISGRRCALGFTLLVLVPLALIYKSQSDLGTTNRIHRHHSCRNRRFRSHRHVRHGLSR